MATWRGDATDRRFGDASAARCPSKDKHHEIRTAAGTELRQPRRLRPVQAGRATMAAAAASGSRRPSAIKVAVGGGGGPDVQARCSQGGERAQDNQGGGGGGGDKSKCQKNPNHPVLPELDRCPAASPEAAIANEKGGWLKPTAFHFKCRPSDEDKSAALSDVRQEASIVSGFRRAPRARSLESALT